MPPTIDKSRFIISPHDARQKRKLVYVDAAKFDQAWAKDRNFYVGPGGTGAAISGRYERFKAFFEDNDDPIIASTVHVREDGHVGFTDGRHRFAYLRDIGMPSIPVTMNRIEIARARKFNLLADDQMTEASMVEYIADHGRVYFHGTTTTAAAEIVAKNALEGDRAPHDEERYSSVPGAIYLTRKATDALVYAQNRAHKAGHDELAMIAVDREDLKTYFTDEDDVADFLEQLYYAQERGTKMQSGASAGEKIVAAMNADEKASWQNILQTKSPFRKIRELARSVVGRLMQDPKGTELADAIAKMTGETSIAAVGPIKPKYAMRVPINTKNWLKDGKRIEKTIEAVLEEMDTSNFARDIRGKLKETFPTVDTWISSTSVPDMVILSRIVVPKTDRNNGLGTKVMEWICAAADAQGVTIALTPSTDFGGSSTDRLKSFYRRFGFVPNKGRYKDFRISEAMIRMPRNLQEASRPIPIKGDPIQDLKKHLLSPQSRIDVRFWDWMVPQWAEATGEFNDRPRDENDELIVGVEDLTPAQRRKFATYVERHYKNHMEIDWQPNMVMAFIRDVKPDERLYHYTSPSSARKIVSQGFVKGAGLYNLTCTKEKCDVDQGKGPFGFAFLDNQVKNSDDLGKALVSFKARSAILVYYPADKSWAYQVIFDKNTISDAKIEKIKGKSEAQVEEGSCAEELVDETVKHVRTLVDQGRGFHDLGRVGWFRLYVDRLRKKPQSGVVTNSKKTQQDKQMIEDVKRAALLATKMLTKAGFRRQSRVLVASDYNRDRRNSITGGKIGGVAIAAYHGITLDTSSRRSDEQQAEIVVHEWLHMFYEEIPKALKDAWKRFWKTHVVDGLSRVTSSPDTKAEIEEKVRWNIDFFLDKVKTRKDEQINRKVDDAMFRHESGFPGMPVYTHSEMARVKPAIKKSMAYLIATSVYGGHPTFKLAKNIRNSKGKSLSAGEEIEIRFNNVDGQKPMMIFTDEAKIGSVINATDYLVTHSFEEAAEYIDFDSFKAYLQKHHKREKIEAFAEDLLAMANSEDTFGAPFLMMHKFHPDRLERFIDTIGIMLVRLAVDTMFGQMKNFQFESSKVVVDTKTVLSKWAKVMTDENYRKANTGTRRGTIPALLDIISDHIKFDKVIEKIAEHQINGIRNAMSDIGNPSGEEARNFALEKDLVASAYGAANPDELWTTIGERIVMGKKTPDLLRRAFLDVLEGKDPNNRKSVVAEVLHVMQEGFSVTWNSLDDEFSVRYNDRVVRYQWLSDDDRTEIVREFQKFRKADAAERYILRYVRRLEEPGRIQFGAGPRQRFCPHCQNPVAWQDPKCYNCDEPLNEVSNDPEKCKQAYRSFIAPDIPEDLRNFIVDAEPKARKRYKSQGCEGVAFVWVVLLEDAGFGKRTKVVFGDYEGQSFGGETPTLGGHVWLELDGAIFDPTAGQFDDYPEMKISNYHAERRV